MQIDSWKSIFSDLLVNITAAWIITILGESQNPEANIPVLFFRMSSVIVGLIVANQLREEAV